MATITTRAGKGAPLTNAELDANFEALNAALPDTVNAAALHRSPNAITALFLYDTGKDSDGGAWIERCQHTSWYNEPLNGKWLGAQASEAAARAVSGATTGDYFQLTTDGKFYKLNAGAGTTEVFRGNAAKFPRLAAIVAEAAGVTVYDLTQAGRPMWMRIDARPSGVMIINSGGQSITSVAALNGTLLIGGAAATEYGWLYVFRFPADKVTFYDQQAVGHHIMLRGIDARHAVGYNAPSTGQLVSPLVRSVAMTVLPDAPADVATGLQVPTIAVATAGGVSVIKPDGTVVNSLSTDDTKHCAIDGGVLYLSNRYAQAALARFIDLRNIAAGWAATEFSPHIINVSGNGDEYQVSPGRSVVAIRTGSAQGLRLSVVNRSAINNSLRAQITNKYNAGYMTGDIRRACLANTEVESITAPELVTNGTFATDTTGWTASAAVLSVDTGRLKVQANSTSNGMGYQTIPTVVGRAYVVEATITAGANTNQLSVGTGAGSENNYSTDWSTGSRTVRAAFVATGAWTYITCYVAPNTGLAYFDNISVKEAVTDRSYKNKPLSIYGTLTKTAVAAAAQLVAFSGFSAANYLQEPYSADLDFSTGSWSVGAWVNYSTAVASTIACREAATGAYIRLGTDATGKLTATAYDGTTTRTVTTTAAYNAGAWTEAEAAYTTDGKLAIKVNGVEVASATGAALLTLNNASAVLTIGNSYALNAPFPGSVALVKLGATVPTAEQALWMYEQERQMFRDGAQVTLPDSGAIVDLAYDEAQDKWVAVSAANESSWTGLVRTATAPVSAGSISKVSAASGVKLLARSTTSPGVDVTIPAYGLREELVKRAEAAARIAKNITLFDFDAVTAQTDFVLPVGYTARAVLSAGALKREGATKDYTRLFDGFRETVRFGVAPGNAVWVQIHAVKE